MDEFVVGEIPVIDGVPMGKPVVSEGNTVPPEMAYRHERDSIKISDILRECCSNGENFEATHAFSVILWAWDHYWLWFFHNGKPFKNLFDDIIKLGVTPYRSTFQGKAIHGNGLIASAAASHTEPLLLIWSRTEEEGIRIGGGTALENGDWQRFDATEIWGPKLEELIGNVLQPRETKISYTVGYGFKIKLNNNKTRTFINPSVANTMAAMAPNMLGSGRREDKDQVSGNLRLVYSEAVIGHPDGSEKYARYDTSSSSGNLRRYALSYKALIDRYSDGYYEFPCRPFDVIDTSTDQSIMIEDAIWAIHSWPAKRDLEEFEQTLRQKKRRGKRARPGKSTYDLILRDCNSGGFKSSKGDEREWGRAATHKCFLVLPWIYDYMLESDPNNSHRFLRFRDNALGTYQQMNRLMSNLGLPYHEGKIAYAGPWVSMHLIIRKVSGIGKKMPDGTYVKTKATAKAVLNMFGRRSDFTFSRVEMIREIMVKASEAAAQNVPPELRQWCENHFPTYTEDMMPIYFEDVLSTKRQKSHQSAVIIFDIDNGGAVFDGKLQTNTSRRFAVWHKKLVRFISPEETTILGSTRGIKHVKLPEWGVENTVNDIIEQIKRLDPNSATILDKIRNGS